MLDRLTPVVLIGGLLVLCSVLFYAYPQIDLAVSAWFYTPGARFFGQTPKWEALRDAGRAATPVAAGLCVLLLLRPTRRVQAAGCLMVLLAAFWFYTPSAEFLGQTPWWDALRDAVRTATPVAAGIGIGGLLLRPICGLLLLRPMQRVQAAGCLMVLLVAMFFVHPVFKSNWGRARPGQTLEFGGSKQFAPAWVVSDQCPRNCSFISGESAGGFWFVAPALCVRSRWRRYALSAAFVWGSLMAWVRVAAGAHYLSDVVIAALITLALCFWVMPRANVLALRSPPARVTAISLLRSLFASLKGLPR